MTPSDLRDHVVGTRLAGAVATTPRNSLRNRRLVQGEAKSTFGLSDHRDATLDEAVAAVEALCGAALAGADPSAPARTPSCASTTTSRRASSSP